MIWWETAPDTTPSGKVNHARIFPAYPHLTDALIPVFQFLLACPDLAHLYLHMFNLIHHKMKTYKKNYIGKGFQVPNMQIARVTVKVEDLLKHTFEYEGVEYCRFEVAKMQNPDKYGRDYTAYVVTTEEVAKEKPKSKTRKPKKPQEENLPF
jgi:hypothetical protein